jgi:hypothetical protein
MAIRSDKVPSGMTERVSKAAMPAVTLRLRVWLKMVWPRVTIVPTDVQRVVKIV